MKIGILSDIHGNHYALESVLKEAEECGVEKLLILGDIVGYYYYPELVIKFLSRWSIEMIKGNHEEMLSEALINNVKASKIKEKYGSGIDFAINKLDNNSITYLTNLPSSKNIHHDGITIYMCHGAPWDMNYYVYPDSGIEIMDRCAIGGYDYVFFGHSHYPFVYNKNGCVIVNAGSVGQSRDKGGLASWCVLDTLNKVLVFKKTPYPIDELIIDAKKIDPGNKYLYEVLFR